MLSMISYSAMESFISDLTLLLNDLWHKELSGISISETFYWIINRCRYMFYLATPSETMFPEVSQVPRLVVEVNINVNK